MKNKLHVLIALKNNYHAIMAARELKEKFSNSVIENQQTGSSVLKSMMYKDFDIVIMDHQLADTNSSSLLSNICLNKIMIPVIVLIENKSDIPTTKPERGCLAEYYLKNKDFQYDLPRFVEQTYRKFQKSFEKKYEDEIIIDSSKAEIVNLAADTLSHEINNPLMTILGTVELIMESSKNNDHELFKKAQMIQDSAKRIHASLSNLANGSRLSLRETVSGRIIESKGNNRPDKSTHKPLKQNNFS